MKLDKSFIGGMLGIMGVQVGLGVLDHYLNGPTREKKNCDYEPDAVREMIEAARTGNLRGFTKVYKTERPHASGTEVYEKYTEFQRILKEG